MQPKWKLPKENPELSKQLSQKTNISQIASQVLINRGITTSSEVRNFLNPPDYTPKQCSYIPKLKEAAELILKSIKNNILIFGDYDVDGITGTALLYEVLTSLGCNVRYYIPHRFNEGYGLNKNVIDLCKNEGIPLIITVDCGINNIEEIKYANENQIDVIITDHHSPPPILPPANVIINPKLNTQNNPGFNLSGVGVAFKLAEALYFLSKKNINLEGYLDLVALGTISDIVPLLDENRLLTIHGLKRLNQTKRSGLKHLCQIARIKPPYGSREIGFYIGPRLNAAGRLEHASLSIELLLAPSSKEAVDIAQKLNKINSSRQKISKHIKEDVENKIKNEIDLDKDKVIILSSCDWHPGVIGIVASQLSKKYSRPTVLISENEDSCRGSARSISNFNIFKIFQKINENLIDFGGHAEAVGFVIKKNKIQDLKLQLTHLINKALDENKLSPLINIDTSIKAKDISLNTARELLLFAPYGQKNPQPTLACYDLNILDYTLVGGGQHLKATFTDKNGEILLDAIGFNMPSHIKTLNNGKVALAFSLEVNNYYNYETTQLKLVDIQNTNA